MEKLTVDELLLISTALTYYSVFKADEINKLKDCKKNSDPIYEENFLSQKIEYTEEQKNIIIDGEVKSIEDKIPVINELNLKVLDLAKIEMDY